MPSALARRLSLASRKDAWNQPTTSLCHSFCRSSGGEPARYWLEVLRPIMRRSAEIGLGCWTKVWILIALRGRLYALTGLKIWLLSLKSWWKRRQVLLTTSMASDQFVELLAKRSWCWSKIGRAYVVKFSHPRSRFILIHLSVLWSKLVCALYWYFLCTWTQRRTYLHRSDIILGKSFRLYILSSYLYNWDK